MLFFQYNFGISLPLSLGGTMAIVGMTSRDFLKCVFLEISQQAVKRLNLKSLWELLEKNFSFSWMCKLGAAEGPSHGRRWFKSETQGEIESW